MRINARLDEASQKQLEYLAQATGQSVSQVVRESLARYHAEVTARHRPPMKFLAMVGQGSSGRTDLATNYKQVIAESMAAKHGLDDRRR
jgi:Ribbon-helix-helix protein, copG family